jgi:hypothetical protein
VIERTKADRYAANEAVLDILPSLIDAIGRMLSRDPLFQVATEALLALDNFPNHKLGITLRIAKIRQLGA